MTIKFIPKRGTKEEVQLKELEVGSAFRFEGYVHIATDEDDKDGDYLCLRVHPDPGYLAHFGGHIKVEPVSLTITED